MDEIVQKEVVKYLNRGILYPIFDNQCVNLVQDAFKKSSATAVKNNDGKCVPTRQITR